MQQSALVLQSSTTENQASSDQANCDLVTPPAYLTCFNQNISKQVKPFHHRINHKFQCKVNSDRLKAHLKLYSAMLEVEIAHDAIGQLIELPLYDALEGINNVNDAILDSLETIISDPYHEKGGLLDLSLDDHEDETILTLGLDGAFNVYVCDYKGVDPLLQNWVKHFHHALGDALGAMRMDDLIQEHVCMLEGYIDIDFITANAQSVKSMLKSIETHDYDISLLLEDEALTQDEKHTLTAINDMVDDYIELEQVCYYIDDFLLTLNIETVEILSIDTLTQQLNGIVKKHPRLLHIELNDINLIDYFYQRLSALAEIDLTQVYNNGFSEVGDNTIYGAIAVCSKDELWAHEDIFEQHNEYRYQDDSFTIKVEINHPQCVNYLKALAVIDSTLATLSNF